MGFEDRDLVPSSGEQIAGGKAAHPGSDDGDLFHRLSFSDERQKFVFPFYSREYGKSKFLEFSCQKGKFKL